jgi:hypothetical protein
VADDLDGAKGEGNCPHLIAAIDTLLLADKHRPAGPQPASYYYARASAFALTSIAHSLDRLDGLLHARLPSEES